MPRLSFRVQGAEAISYAAAPMIGFSLHVENAGEEAIHSVALRCQILIEASRRHYSPAEREGLRDLFGEPNRWSQTLRSQLWTHLSVNVPAFTGSIVAQMPVPCTFDFNVAASKYFHAVEDADVPLCFQFSGTVFYAGANEALQIDQIGWDKEARFRLPVSVWRDMMDHYYPDSAWLRLGRSAFERLHAYKQREGIATWEEAIERLVPA